MIRTPSRLDTTAKSLFVISVIVLTVFFAGKIVIPIIFSGIIAIFLFPILKRLEKIGFNRFFSTLVTVLVVTALLISILFVLGYESRQILGGLPDIPVEQMLNQPVELMEEKMNVKISSKYGGYINSALEKGKAAASELIPKTLLNLKNTLVFFITCPIYVFFMLLYTDHLRSFYFSIFNGDREEKAAHVLEDINGAYAGYIKGMLIVISIVTLLTSLGLFLLGIDYPIFLGFLAGILVLIPYVGVFVSALIPVALALVTKDTYWYALGVVGIFAVVQFLEGNVITPKIVGNQVGLNPLVVIVGIIVLGSIAGIAGMIITIPLLALFKVISRHVPSWEPVRLLLKD